MLYDDRKADERAIEGSGIRLGRAADFLAHLNPQQDRWAGSRWIYRGQGDAKLALRPTILRKRGVLEAFGVSLGGDDVKSLDASMRQALVRFRVGLDEAGIMIPDLPAVDGVFPNDVPRAGVFEADEIPLMALARHHGLPTILLDWSKRAYVAAYFAATHRLAPRCDHDGDPRPSPEIAVWALRANEPAFGESGRLSLHGAPGWTNPNMRAQSGLFTILRAMSDDAGGNSVDGFCFAELERGAVPPVLRRISLPATEAPELLRRLAVEGIDGASMFPGADGIVRAMREVVLWETSDEIDRAV